MAYWFGLYLPTNSGITSATVYTDGGSLLASGIQPAGTSTPAWSRSGITTGLSITPNLQSGVSVSRWVVNVEGTVYYQYTHTCTVGYSASATTVQIRLEVTGTPTVTYYANLSFNANGGSGAPSTVYGSSMDGTGYVQMSIPYTTPTRSGYTFVGWSMYADGSGTIRYPGGTYTGYGSTSYPGPNHTLYAVWQKKDTTYYAYLAYNANGGSGAPSTHLVSGTTQTFNAQISSTVPVRDGYTFAGWWLYNIEDYGTYPAGGQVPITGTADSPNSTPHTLYAQWKKKGSSGAARIGPNFNNRYVPYVFYGGEFRKATPHVWNGGWKKGI